MAEMVKQRMLSIVYIFLAMLAFYGPSSYSNAQEKRLFGYSAMSGTMGPIWMAKEAGLFEKYGLHVDLIYLQGGVPATMAMVSGEVPISQIGPTPVITSALQGSDLILIASVINSPVQVLVSTKEINRPEDLKGKKVGISRFGDPSDISTRLALKRFGIDPDKDVIIVQSGASGPDRFAALTAGSIVATTIPPPFTLVARKLGFRVLVDLSKSGIELPTSSVATSKSFIRANRDVVRKFMKGYVSGIHLFKTQKEKSMGVMSKYLRLNDMEAIEEAYNAFSSNTVRAPHPKPSAFEVLLGEIAKRNEKAKTAKPEQFMDSTFVRELDEAGFIDGLYR